MIERYTRAEMKALWDLTAKYQTWLDVELAVTEVQESLGRVPAGVTEQLRRTATFCVERIDELDAQVKHDVIAFLTCVNESVGDLGRHIHVGLTSSDVIDTGLALQLQRVGQLLMDDVAQLRSTILMQAQKHKHTGMIGRSHGVFAEPTTFGLKCLLWADELGRHQQRLAAALEECRVGQMSGPVGTYSAIDPEVERLTCEKLGLKPAAISNQIIQRDIHASFMNAVALIASSLEKFAVEIRHLQRSDVLEVEEPFTVGQKGSSAMPHKRNPVGSENITGLARLVRSYAIPMMENIALWHERDISHSSVERVVLPDATIALDYMLHRFNGIMNDLVVYPERMQRNMLSKGGIIFSQHVLLALVETGMTREDAYQLVQAHAHTAWLEDSGDFRSAVERDPAITQRVSSERLAECFDVGRMLQHVDTIFKRFESPVLAS